MLLNCTIGRSIKSQQQRYRSLDRLRERGNLAVSKKECFTAITGKLKRFAQVGIALCFSVSVYAQQEIRVRVIKPLTGPAASTDAEKNALELAADIINNGAKGISNLPFSSGGGLPNLKGAKMKLVFGDHQGNPQVGATEAERPITQEKVAALGLLLLTLLAS